MKRHQPVRVTYRNGAVSDHEVDMFNVWGLLRTLDFDKVAGIEYGEAIVNKGPVEIKLSGIDTGYSESAATIRMNLYDKNDKRVAFVDAEPVKFQQFAVNLLQQTTYRFEDAVRKQD